MVQKCDSYNLLYLWWCLLNMWVRILIKCDCLLTLESKKQISPLHIYVSEQVSATHPPSSKLLWKKEEETTTKTKEKKCDLFRAYLYFEEVILNQNH